MFYKMINGKRDEWYSSDDCMIKSLIDYMVDRGQLRDIQADAIKTYLFLKIQGGCQPLSKRFVDGFFNIVDIDELEVSKQTRDYLKDNPAAVALYEYATLKSDSGEQVSAKLEKQIIKEPDSIDYTDFFKNVFYGVFL